jgi:hypothetical protein
MSVPEQSFCYADVKHVSDRMESSQRLSAGADLLKTSSLVLPLLLGLFDD